MHSPYAFLKLLLYLPSSIPLQNIKFGIMQNFLFYQDSFSEWNEMIIQCFLPLHLCIQTDDLILKFLFFRFSLSYFFIK